MYMGSVNLLASETRIRPSLSPWMTQLLWSTRPADAGSDAHWSRPW